MARRDDDDFDDEDYEPRPRNRRDSGGGSTFPYMLFGMLGLGGLVVAGLFVFVIGRTRNAMERATQAVAAEREAAVAQLKQAQGQPAAAPANWPKLIGAWSRQPADKEEGGYPYRFEFRTDRTCTATRAGPGGEPVQQDATVEVVADQNDLVRLALIIPAGRYVYSFRLKPDGTLVLDDGKDGLVFTRAK